MTKILLLLYICLPLKAFSTEKIIYKYKQFEKFDLGDLEVKGKIIAPGDLTIHERERKVFKRELFNRMIFQKEIKESIINLR